MNPDNFNMSEQELNAQRRRRAENFKLNIDESEYEDDNFVKSEDEPSNLNSYSGQDVKKQMARESKQVLKQKKKEEKKGLLKQRTSIIAEPSALSGLSRF